MYQRDQDDFYNMVIAIDTNLIPLDLLIEIKKIEIKSGRIPKSKKNITRILDIDILAIGDFQIQSKILEIPHPRILERRFVLKPWSDIAPEFTLPDSSQTVSDLLENTTDISDVRMVLILDKEGMI
jgi:2-amino-4-hydroxy-6-hydroxymethyldihydropteridine diphosphokinase